MTLLPFAFSDGILVLQGRQSRGGNELGCLHATLIFELGPVSSQH